MENLEKLEALPAEFSLSAQLDSESLKRCDNKQKENTDKYMRYLYKIIKDYYNQGKIPKEIKIKPHLRLDEEDAVYIEFIYDNFRAYIVIESALNKYKDFFGIVLEHKEDELFINVSGRITEENYKYNIQKIIDEFLRVKE